MNMKEWKRLSNPKNKNERPKDFWKYRNMAKKYFNLQKGEVIHHLRTTPEQEDFNNKYYERWGFDFNEQMKYCVKMTKEEHDNYHAKGRCKEPFTEEHRKNLSKAMKKLYATEEGKRIQHEARKKQQLHPNMGKPRIDKIKAYNNRPEIKLQKRLEQLGRKRWINVITNEVKTTFKCPGENWIRYLGYKKKSIYDNKPLRCINTGKIYNDIEEAVKDTGIRRRRILNLLNGVQTAKTERAIRFEWI